MDVTILSALIALAGSIIGTFAGILTTAKLTNYRLSQLEKKVDAHNNLIERTYKLEEKDSLCEEKIKVINHRIADLEEERER